MFTRDKTSLSYVSIVVTAVLGALNDNLLKAAVIVFAALSVPADQAASVGLLAGALLMAPFVLFSGWAGIMADRFEKAAMIRAVKWSELALACLATGAMASGSIPLMLGIVFAMGAQSAFFGPLKLGWLPERLRPDQLVGANSWLDTGTFLAILAGTVAGGLLSGPETLVWAGGAAIAVAGLGVLASHLLPRGARAAPKLRIPVNPLAGNWRVLKTLFSDSTAVRAAVLDAWFWAIGSVYLSTLPAYLRMRLGGGETMLTVVMALFAIGIGTGAALASLRLRGRITPRLVLPSGLLIAASAFGLHTGFDALEPGSGMAGLFGAGGGLFVVASLFLIAVGGGMFAIPLKAVIQARAGTDQRAQVMAGFNTLSATSIVAASILLSLGVGAGLELRHVFLAIAVSSIVAAVASAIFFARDALQWLGRAVLLPLFRVRVIGREHLATEGPVVFVSNHVSFADGPLLFSLIERETAIAVNSNWARGPLLGRLARILRIAPIDPQSPMATKGLAREVREGGAALVFPEGRISTHGALMKVYPGTAWMVDAAEAPVVPIHIDGLEASRFTRPITGMARRLFPRVVIRVGAPRTLDVPADAKGAARRKLATRALQDMLELGRLDALSTPRSIPNAFHAARKRFDSRANAICDPLGTSLTRGRIATGAAAFSALLTERTAPGEHVGILLPGVAAAPVVLLGLWRAGRVPAILNPTLGAAPMLSAIETGGIEKIITSRDFVEKAEIGDVVAELEQQGIQILWTDALKAEIGPRRKLAALWASRHAADLPPGPDDPAAILFTSGTEGVPKGVVLTHGNLVANVAQLQARTDIGPADRVLNAMPLFHSFGLTAGVLLPLMAGAPMMIYPSPLNYKIVPEMAYGHQATLIFGTDTFLAGWGRRANPYDFSSVRAAIAGAEAVKPATRALWSEKFGVRILEGFGATEAGPVIALNTPMEGRNGTVGRALPGIALHLDEVPGVDGRRLSIKGPNVMAGYLLPGGNGVLRAPEDGWYDTGDIVTLDEDGFIRIVGRAKRFAKVGGEMVSLAAAEALAAEVWPDAHVAAISMPDARKGEKVVLVTDHPGADRKALSSAARVRGIAEITVPADVLVRNSIPLLASGKTDYPALTKTLTERAQEAA